MLKKKLTAANIAYEENTDINEMRSLGLLSAPALKVGDNLMLFNEAVAWVNEQGVNG